KPERESQHDDHRERKVVAHGAKGVELITAQRLEESDRIHAIDLLPNLSLPAGRSPGRCRRPGAQGWSTRPGPPLPAESRRASTATGRACARCTERRSETAPTRRL